MKIPHQRAFTLIELLVTVALLAIFATIAMPSMTRFVERNRIEALRDQLHAQLNLARTNAVVQRRDVEICGSSDGKTCDENWQKGWMLYFMDNRQPIGQHRLGLQDRVMFVGFNKQIIFHENGTALGNGRFYLCEQDGKVAQQLVLNKQGRTRRVAGLESDQDQNLICE